MIRRSDVVYLLGSSRFSRKNADLARLITSEALTNNSVNCFVELFGLEDVTGSICLVESFHLEAACYAGLPNKAKVPGAVPLAVVVGIQKKAFTSLSRELIEEYFKWLSKESQFSEAVYGYTIGESSGSLTVKGTVDARLVVGALTAARTPHEFPEIISRWDRLRNLGFNKRAAFLIAHHMDEKAGVLVKGKTYSIHTVLDTNNMGRQSVLAFIKGEVKGEAKEYWEQGASYRGIQALWEEPNYREATTIPLLMTRYWIRTDPEYKVDRFGFHSKDLSLTPLGFCKALGMSEKDMFDKIPPKPESRKVSARTLRERAYKAFINKCGTRLTDNAVYLKDLRISWLKSHPLSEFEEKDV